MEAEDAGKVRCSARSGCHNVKCDTLNVFTDKKKKKKAGSGGVQVEVEERREAGKHLKTQVDSSPV